MSGPPGLSSEVPGAGADADGAIAPRVGGDRGARPRPGRYGPGGAGHGHFDLHNRPGADRAAVGLGQLERIDGIVARKRWMGAEYTRRLKDIKGLQLPTEEPWARNVYWMYGVVLSEEVEMDATQLALRLQELGVETRPFFWGMHEQPVFRKQGLFVNEHYPMAERLARRGLYLPSGLALTEDQLARVCDAVHEVLS